MERFSIVGIASSHFFFFNDTATTEIYTLSLHDALPIFECLDLRCEPLSLCGQLGAVVLERSGERSEEHTSELQSQSNLVCRLLLEKKKIHHEIRKPVLPQYSSHH